jgi:AcrR family transcriptional regulator
VTPPIATPTATARPALPERSARVAEIVGVARRVLEEEGRDALTMRRIAEVMGIKAPSIYKHLDGKHQVELALLEEGLAEMGDALHAAVGAADGARDRVAALLAVYRREASAHPNLYRLATIGTLPRDELTPGLEDWAGEPFFLVTGDPFVAQALFSFAHGLVTMEIDGRCPPGSDLDRTWAAGAAAFTA